MNKKSYQTKDLAKFKLCNKLISRGAENSSSGKYLREGIGSIKPEMVNTGEYSHMDSVGISVNGRRFKRVKADWKEIDKAIDAGVTFYTDNSFNRNRDYNIGEREVAGYLLLNGYKIGTENNVFALWTIED